MIAVATWLRGIRREERGTSVVEFALFAPILAALLLGITDLAMGYARKMAVEQAANRALERVQVGSLMSSYAFVQAEAASAAGVPVNQVAVDHWRECAGTRQGTVTGTCPSGQERSIFVSVAITASYTPQFVHGVLPTVNGSVPITANASLRVQ